MLRRRAPSREDNAAVIHAENLSEKMYALNPFKVAAQAPVDVAGLRVEARLRSEVNNSQ